MQVGKTLFAQLMDFLPWTTFTRIVARYGGDYHMGFRQPVRRSTLADANELCDWRIYAELAHRLIAQARKLYAGEDLGLDLANTVHALDSTTLDLCLSVFPWAHFRATKAAVKMHTAILHLTYPPP